jgi:hypothetical protein
MENVEVAYHSAERNFNIDKIKIMDRNATQL